ncbi:DNA methyltransferase [Cupriavidus sp. TA19]|uniref:DNA cytosine methyltransferase n=1 Tax=unclassified Cupriavidus TaxID=2640874 RepID=UPI0027294397|nr:DNA cytosine methyltransferase [Cupriavidus sp. TA19]GLC92354.1 DNA methyltransferase [Cupriavidus sp. TA19]
MIRDQFLLDIAPEIIVDNFAGGGGASCGIELALGRHVDIAINHDPEAVAMHAMNHPQTEHHCESVWDVDPLDLVKGRPVGLAWFSPDCKHFSKAKGGKPRDKKIRGLAWVAMRWAALVRPRVIVLENVEEFQTWGPVLADGNPCPKRKGDTFRSFVHQLQEKGYAVEWREMRACDYGAPTIRKRLFLIARCDGKPIVWPQPTHGAPDSAAVKARQRKPWRTAAECIDWSIPCPSIFERTRPLAEATQRRIARGLRRYVIDSTKPFTVKLPTISTAPIITECANASNERSWRADEPLRTQCAEVKGGHFALASATLIQTGYGERPGQAPRAPGLDKPLGTAVAGGVKHALVSAFLAKHYGGNYDGPGVGLDTPASTITTADHHALVSAQLVGCGGRAEQSRPRDASEPMQTITAKGDTAIAASHLVKLRGECTGSAADEPVSTVTAGGKHIGEVRAFLVKYYSEGGQDQDCRDPMHTIPTKDRLGLVTVAGEQYQIADIGMRMLVPPELYRAQGFPSSYIFAPTIDPADPLLAFVREALMRIGKIKAYRLPQHAQVRMCGNSVSPPMAAALVRANVPDMVSWSAREKRSLEAAA